MTDNKIKISSKLTFYYKNIFPVFWFGILAIILIAGLVSTFYTDTKNDPSIPVLIIPIVMSVFGYVLMKKLVFDLVDEVFDCGDFLLINNKKNEQKIYLTDISNISYSHFQNPPRVTLSIRKNTILGDEISFAAPVKFGFFVKHPVIQNLIKRVDDSRNIK